MSVIIPTRSIDASTRECVSKCRELDDPNVEILVLPDGNEAPLEGARVIPTGPVPPGVKRNVGAKHAEGAILAFIDSDAYPRKDWLKNARRYLERPDVAAVGGPGITPPTDNAIARASGEVLGSFMMGGRLSSRYTNGQLHETDDIHSCNFIAKRAAIEAAGGWNERYWPGEDTLMCLNIKRAGFRQFLAPDVVVYHHRRGTIMAYLRQIWNYGKHRGFFAKRFPETSKKVVYFAPTALLLAFPVAALAYIVYPGALPLIWLASALYLLAVLVASLKTFKLAPMVFVGIPLTHLTYGAAFLTGLVARDLER